jgi:hypothetical protein
MHERVLGRVCCGMVTANLCKALGAKVEYPKHPLGKRAGCLHGLDHRQAPTSVRNVVYVYKCKFLAFE